jgi:D-alanyl-D-alanine carboxypeptidase
VDWQAFRARAIVGQASYSLPAGDGHHAYKWRNTNPPIGRYAGATRIKTGDTKAAGNCLLFEASRGGLTLIGVTLGTPGGDISDTRSVATKVLNWVSSTTDSRSASCRDGRDQAYPPGAMVAVRADSLDPTSPSPCVTISTIWAVLVDPR